VPRTKSWPTRGACRFLRTDAAAPRNTYHAQPATTVHAVAVPGNGAGAESLAAEGHKTRKRRLPAAVPARASCRSRQRYHVLFPLGGTVVAALSCFCLQRRGNMPGFSCCAGDGTCAAVSCERFRRIHSINNTRGRHHCMPVLPFIRQRPYTCCRGASLRRMFFAAVAYERISLACGAHDVYLPSHRNDGLAEHKLQTTCTCLPSLPGAPATRLKAAGLFSTQERRCPFRPCLVTFFVSAQ